MADRPQVCSICNQKAFGYNYDVVSCNACKMFFRRAHIEKIDERCKKGGKCYDGVLNPNSRPKCRACRFRKCQQLGMRHHSSTDSESTSSSTVSTVSTPSPKVSMIVAVQKPIITQAHLDSRLFQQMILLHETRRNVYMRINVCEDPSFTDLVLQGSNLSKYNRPQEIQWETTERKLKPWGSLGVLLIVEIIKAMDFYNELLLSDRVILLKNVAFKCHHLAIAFDSFMAKKGRVLAPSGEEMFPLELFSIPKCKEIIMDLLTSPMQPLVELNLTEQEYLLLNMIMICNPALGGLSQVGREVLTERQTECSRLLFDTCMQIGGPRNGATRYVEVLAIIEKLERQKSVTNRVCWELRNSWKPDFHFSEVIVAACNLDSRNPPKCQAMDTF